MGRISWTTKDNLTIEWRTAERGGRGLTAARRGAHVATEPVSASCLDTTPHFLPHQPGRRAAVTLEVTVTEALIARVGESYTL